MAESRGQRQPLDLVGLVLISAGLLVVVRAVQGAERAGWSDAGTLIQLAVGGALIVGFVGWENRAPEPMLPLSLLRMPSFAAANASGFLMGAALFSSGVLITQYFQLGRGYSPTESGLGLLPWTATPILCAPIAGRLAESVGQPAADRGRVGAPGDRTGLVRTGSRRQHLLSQPDAAVVRRRGWASRWSSRPWQRQTLEVAGPAQTGVASSTANASRQVGGAIGIAAIGAVFLAAGGFESVAAIVDGLGPALITAAAVSIIGALTGLAVRPAPAPGADPALAPKRDE